MSKLEGSPMERPGMEQSVLAEPEALLREWPGTVMVYGNHEQRLSAFLQNPAGRDQSAPKVLLPYACIEPAETPLARSLRLAGASTIMVSTPCPPDVSN